ncbi:hypothetical protein [Lentilactobacillus sp. Marseille-Q4993]|uniref:hypothetical protein n=1 Tax=Lentilactobacillus sp. Marseille-Q4993 TaxID=3039492 RepID=UPI0024BD0877|nr:hypothetical protein [Lentilactobacillus sp. Marseille-Q4993]
MSEYNDTVLTNAGMDLASRAAIGKTSFKITRAESTGDDLSSTDLKTLTKLPNKKQDGSIVGDSNVTSAIKQIEVYFENRNLTTGYNLNAVGLYAKEDGKSEILFAVTTAEQAQQIPDFGDKVLLQFTLGVQIVVGNQANVTVVLDPLRLATKTYVDDAIAKIKDNSEISTRVKVESGESINSKLKSYANTNTFGYIDISADAANNTTGKYLRGLFFVNAANAIMYLYESTSNTDKFWLGNCSVTSSNIFFYRVGDDIDLTPYLKIVDADAKYAKKGEGPDLSAYQKTTDADSKYATKSTTYTKSETETKFAWKSEAANKASIVERATESQAKSDSAGNIYNLYITTK